MLMQILFIVIIVMVIIILAIIGIIFSQRLKSEVAKNKEIASNYSNGLIIGFVSGIVVLVLDKVVILITQGLPKIDKTNILSVISSSLGILLMITLIASFLYASIIWVIYSGIKGLTKKKSK